MIHHVAYACHAHFIVLSLFSLHAMDLDEVVDTSDVEEREFDASEPDYYSYLSPDKRISNPGRATALNASLSGRSIVRQEGQPSPRKRVKVELDFQFKPSRCAHRFKTTHSESETKLIVNLSTSSNPLPLTPVKSTLSSAPHASVPHFAINTTPELSLQVSHAHEPSLHNETPHTHSQEPNINELVEHTSLNRSDSGDSLLHEDHPISSTDLRAQTQADPQSPLPDSSQLQLDDALFPSSPTPMTSPPLTPDVNNGGVPPVFDMPVPHVPSEYEGLVSSSSPPRSRPADSWSLFSSPPGPSTQSSHVPQQSTQKPAYETRDSSPLTHHSGGRSPSPDELVLIPPVSRLRYLQSPVIQRSRDSSLPALSPYHRSPLPPQPPPVIPSPPIVIPEDLEPANRYSLRRRQARQLQPYAYDKAMYKAQMKANPDAIVKFVSRETHAGDGSQWENGQTQGESQVEYIFPVDNPEDEDYVQSEERRRRRRAEADRHDHAQEGEWLPEALRDLSDSDEIEGGDEVRKLVRDARRARKKAEAEARKKEKQEARLRAQEKADKQAEARGIATKRRLKNFPLASTSSSNQPAAGPSSKSPRQFLDEVRFLKIL